MAVIKYREALADFRRIYWFGVLKLAKGNMPLAAKIGGVTRTSLYDIIKRLSLEDQQHDRHTDI